MPRHTVRAQGRTANTECDPVTVAAAVGLYLIGHSTTQVEERVGIAKGTLYCLLDRLGITRDRSEGQIHSWADRGTVSAVARRRIIERDYTRQEAHHAQGELAERFDVTKRTIRRDLTAIGYSYTQKEAMAASEWGSLTRWRKKQREAAVLVRHRGLTQEEAAQEMGVNKNTVGALLEVYDGQATTDH